MDKSRRAKRPSKSRCRCAVNLFNTALPVAEVAREIGCSEETIYEWIRRVARELNSDEQVELEQLRLQNAELRHERDALLKAAAPLVDVVSDVRNAPAISAEHGEHATVLGGDDVSAWVSGLT